MGNYLLRRLLIAIPTLLGVSVVSFAIIALAPGDVASALTTPDDGGPAGNSAQTELRRQLGLTDPLPVRYWSWLSNVLRGNFGRSLVDQRPVLTTVIESVGLTLQITLPALLIGLTLALLFGVWSASRPYSRFDNIVSLVSVTIAALPRFVLAILFLYLFAVRLAVLPAGGNKAVGAVSASATILDRWQFFVLPVTTLALATASYLVRYVRDSVLNTRTADFVQTARAKGLNGRAVMTHHVLRNALLPIITVTALQIPNLLNGALLVEAVFGWGGLGSRVATALGQRDFPVIMGATLLTGIIVVGANLVADLLYALADPRIRLR